MLYFIVLLEFLASIALLAIALVLTLVYIGWPIAGILLVAAGGWSLLVVLIGLPVAVLEGGFFELLLHLITFGFDLAVFIYALLNYPYSNGCSGSTTKECQLVKAAIGLDGALFGLFLLSAVGVSCYRGYYRRNAARGPAVRTRGPYYYY